MGDLVLHRKPLPVHQPGFRQDPQLLQDSAHWTAVRDQAHACDQPALVSEHRVRSGDRFVSRSPSPPVQTDREGTRPQGKGEVCPFAAHLRLSPRGSPFLRDSRVIASRYGPREIDVDIIFYGDQKITVHSADKKHDLVIPHPLCHERPFVMKPMCDIDKRMSLPSPPSG